MTKILKYESRDNGDEEYGVSLGITSENIFVIGENGGVFGCGENSDGQLGIGTEIDQINPVRIGSIKDKIIQVSCGGANGKKGGHTIFLCSDRRSFWVCGCNRSGQLGLGGLDKVAKPMKISFLSKSQKPLNKRIKTIKCGISSTYLQTNYGELFSCGNNEYFQLGHPDNDNLTSNSLYSSFEKVTFREKRGYSIRKDLNFVFNRFDVGSEFLIVQNRDGRVFGCGSNQYGNLAVQIESFFDIIQPKFREIGSKYQIIDFKCGYYHSTFLTSRGDVFECGRYGGAYRDTLTKVSFNHKVLKIVCGGYHTILQTYQKEFYSLGSNYHGQLALDRTVMTSEVPSLIKFEFGDEILHFFCSYENSYFLTSKGWLLSCGKGNVGGLATGSEKSTSIPRQTKFERVKVRKKRFFEKRTFYYCDITINVV